MIRAIMTSHADFAEWRDLARTLLQNRIDPADVDWSGVDGDQSLFSSISTQAADLPARKGNITCPKKFIEIAARVICFRSADRFARLYRILWRLQSDKTLLGCATDPDIIWMTACDKAVRRDRHKMHAFVRFRKVGIGRYRREQFAAWFEPSHYITELATPFFKRRFPNMDWVIVTPDCTAIWDGTELRFGPGEVISDVPDDDAIEGQWKTYFNSIFNPARLKVGAMMAEMPQKYWKNMPEAVDIPAMIQTAKARERDMRENGISQPNPLASTLLNRMPHQPALYAPPATLTEARKAVQKCQLCPLYNHASQAVFGEGPKDASLMLIGEQPGDQEDIAGRPFVGPAGQVLNDALCKAGITRADAYITNAVKHFKFKVRGKRRIHDRPSHEEIDHCRWWIRAERDLVKPEVIVALGASAARSILGKSVKISDYRGQAHKLSGGEILHITAHPAHILRLPDKGAQAAARQQFVADLTLAKSSLSSCLNTNPADIGVAAR